MTAASSQTFHSASEQDTANLAHRLAAVLKGGEYISLEGDLGAGKTFFARALATAIGVNGPITSPTFVIQKVYAVKGNTRISQLVHYDFYRITSYHELIDLGFEDHADDAVVLAEWGNLFIEDFPANSIRIQFESSHDDSRIITVTNICLQ